MELLSQPSVLLEDRLSEGARARLFSHPDEIISCTDPLGLDEAFARIQAGAEAGFHVAGLVAFEAGLLLEPRLARRAISAPQTPLLWFGLFKHETLLPAELVDAAFAELGPPAPIDSLEVGLNQTAYVQKIAQVLELIAAGDIYQANLTFPMRFRLHDHALRLYGALRSRQPVAHGGFIWTGVLNIASVSPELWINVEDGRATARPMKGTVARGEDAESDTASRRALSEDPKQRAENLMIVDLLRNDLSRIAQLGSVAVPALFSVETYPTLHTMTSTITARLRPDAGLKERFAALFPCGSIVGAPKIRAAEILCDLEAEPRGVYTGAMGRISPTGDMRFNVAIRTAVIRPDGAGSYGVGGGIVFDSEPCAEYREALLKAKVLTDLAEPFNLVETLRLSPQAGCLRLDLHLQRLGRSAKALGFRFPREAIQAALLQCAPAGIWQDMRLRLVLSRSGAFEIESRPLELEPNRRLRACVAKARLDPGDPFLRHKTDLRAVYDAALTQAKRQGCDEAIFLNRRGEIADAARANIFVSRGGKLATPPKSAGLLPGVLREALLRAGEAFEAPLVLGDLRAGFQLGSSLRGLRQAELVEEKDFGE